VIILDSLLIGGLKFVLGKIVSVVDAEMSDDSRLREDLLAAQMRLELGEIDDAAYAALEREILQEIAEIRKRAAGDDEAGSLRVVGVETNFEEGEGRGPADES
jgi:hypothetical protein